MLNFYINKGVTMKEIKTKMEAMLQAKLAEGMDFKNDVAKILGESNLSESVQSDFIDVTESLIVKFGSELASELVESVELDLADSIITTEQNVAEYSEYVNETMETAKADYSDYLSEKAQSYVDYIDTGVDAFSEEMDHKAAQYCEYVNENMDSLVLERMIESQEKLDRYIDYVAESYVEENHLAIERGIKENLLDSLVGDLRVVFEKHNLELPKAINVVDELEEDLSESEDTIDKLVDKVNELKDELSEAKRKMHFNESTKDLTESQKERVQTIVERAQLNEAEYSSKLQTICEMVSTGNNASNEAPEMIMEGSQNYQQLITEKTDSVISEPKKDINMQAYIAAARNFAK